MTQASVTTHTTAYSQAVSVIADLWYLTSVCVLGATLTTTVGVGGPVFLTPLFVLVLKLPPATAVATALFTQLFGFLSASVPYGRRGLINFDVARGLLVVAAPAALLGSLIAPLVPGLLIRRAFGVIALLVAYRATG